MASEITKHTGNNETKSHYFSITENYKTMPNPTHDWTATHITDNGGDDGIKYTKNVKIKEKKENSNCIAWSQLAGLADHAHWLVFSALCLLYTLCP